VPSVPRPTTFPVSAANALRLTLDDLDRARGRGAAVVDARPRHLYLGEPDAPGTGHIPRAYTLSYQELVDGSTGLFQSPVAIRRLAVAAGIDPDDPPAEVVTTCGIGVSATVAMIALELIGIPVSGVYDGAWSEWSADRARAVAYGAG
jgi:thiosulfate/3-mercaptopyruvate sulfurtransferase